MQNVAFATFCVTNCYCLSDLLIILLEILLITRQLAELGEKCNEFLVSFQIMKDICTECPDFPKIPEICVKMIRRVNDEEGGIKKLVMEVFQAMWFSPVREKPQLDFTALMRKV